MFGAEFEPVDVVVSGVRIHAVRGGDGPPVLLLHGFPQSHLMWHRIAPELAREHTVVAADLRGYGDSDRPAAGADHTGYAFRAMAADQVGLMAALGFDRFTVIGHDRGARVTHRMALDQPDRVERLALLDILPTAYVYANVDRTFATAYYRAGASIDLEHDAASTAAGQRIAAPCLVLWGERGVVGGHRTGPLDVWRPLAAEPGLVSGGVIPGAGHFLAEENHTDTLAALQTFLRG